MVIDDIRDLNVSTFIPLEQEVHSNIKYIGMGYMPCNGYVPCQVSFIEMNNLTPSPDIMTYETQSSLLAASLFLLIH